MPRTWDGIVSQQINRKFSRPLARFLASHTKASPNQVTVLSFAVAVLSGLAFFSFQPILGGILAQLSSILDGVDGDLAFLTNKISTFGGFLDSVLDRYGDSLILGGMLYYTFTAKEFFTLNVLVGIAAIIGSLMVSYSRTRAESDLDLTFKEGFAGYAANRDVRLFIIMLGGILNQVFITLLILAVLTNLTVLTRIYNARKAVMH
ncbi:hypothetical protein DRO41_01200 [Candidatus Bathyarchaeota archaeon]|nr:MAG: hypothetical protein DRO41_01200 [Candidatus Bathyarchaeota archaeon]